MLSALKTTIQKTSLMLFMLALGSSLYGQTASPVTVSGYVGTYYAWDTDKNVEPNGGLRQYSFIAPRKETFGLDVAMVSVKYAAERARASVIIQYGDVTNGWGNGATASTNDLFGRYVQEAYAGFMLSNNLWLDAGFFLTHVGEEGFFPKDNFLSSLALTTLFEPFGQSGLRLTYSFNDKWSAQLHLLNGYGLTFGRASTSTKAVGLQIDYRASSEWDFLYNALAGDGIGFGDAEKGKFYTYHNFVAKYFGSKIDLALGVDVASQAKTKLTSSGNLEGALYFSAILEGRFKASKQFNLMARGEIFQDNNGIFGVVGVKDGESVGLKAFGITGGMEFKPMENAFLRGEVRYLSFDKDQKLFRSDKESVNTRTEVIFTTGVSF
jgi:hypothetical protein